MKAKQRFTKDKLKSSQKTRNNKQQIVKCVYTQKYIIRFSLSLRVSAVPPTVPDTEHGTTILRILKMAPQY